MKLNQSYWFKMFTDYHDILLALKQNGLTPTDLRYIPRGVMTDKYSFFHRDRQYIIRCFQSHRHNQPEIEYRYLSLFQKRNIKAPKPSIFSNTKTLPFIVYEMVEGVPLTDSFDSLAADAQKSLCREIASNYLKISEIQNNGFGRIQTFNKFSNDSWIVFIMQVIDNAETMAEKQGDVSMKHCCKRLRKYALKIQESSPDLIWSDFSSDNIIVDKFGNLAGFIDFEGLLSGDATLGIGYMYAHETNTNFISKLMNAFRIPAGSDNVAFYSLIRWCRLMPYQHLPLLNGEEREPLRKFLPNAYRLIKTFGQA